jgi:hypothetical protein
MGYIYPLLCLSIKNFNINFVLTQEINCHKLLLAKSSTVFAAMLYGSLKEDKIRVTDIEYQTFLDLVR